MTHADFHTNQTFGLAAARAFGLDPDRVTLAKMDTSNFDAALAITFEVALKPEDLVRIAQEMARIDGDAGIPASNEPHHSWTVDGMPLTDALAQREVQHLDTGGQDDDPVGLPPHVWLYRNMLTDLQALAPLGVDTTNGQYAVAIDQLTDEQCKIQYVIKQLEAEINAQKAGWLRDLEANANDSQNQPVI